MEDNLNQKLENVDMSKIASLQQKRTLAFVNHFVMINVQFLNNFMKNCEQKLMQFERKLEKVNASMVLLEAKLSSIPELDIVPPTTTESKEHENNQEKSEEDAKLEIEDAKLETEDAEDKESKPETLPEYVRFIKMVQVGVPLQAVKLKVSLEGLDPNVLEGMLGK